jgi:hypothetical protein
MKKIGARFLISHLHARNPVCVRNSALRRSGLILGLPPEGGIAELLHFRSSG